jgi:hypothetical protein
MNIKIAKQRYNEQKYRAKSRGIDFPITFAEWCEIWQQSGNWEQRGRRKGQCVMSRINDQGPYHKNNVTIQLHETNAKDGQIGKKLSPAHIQIIKKHMVGNTHGSKKRSAATCENIRMVKLKYWKNKKQEEAVNG